jgi:hypothetical protein
MPAEIELKFVGSPTVLGKKGRRVRGRREEGDQEVVRRRPLLALSVHGCGIADAASAGA